MQKNDMNVLYHGTTAGGLAELSPISKEGVVYMTPSRAYALFYIRDMEINFVTCSVQEDGRIWYEEWFPGQLEELYAGRSGYLYTCAMCAAFRQTKERDVWVAKERVKISHTTYVPDVCVEMGRLEERGLIEIARYERRDVDRMRMLRAGLPRHIRERGILRAETRKAAFYRTHFPAECRVAEEE